MLTQERLKELLHYDPETGVFTWRIQRGGGVAGDVAGSLNTGGYRQIRVDGRCLLASRLAWLYMTGEWPKNEVDHKDRCRTNNRFSNLRDATRKENMENTNPRKDNASGFRGVSWCKIRSLWLAQIQHCRKKIMLGYFGTKQEASLAYEGARASLFSRYENDK